MMLTMHLNDAKLKISGGHWYAVIDVGLPKTDHNAACKQPEGLSLHCVLLGLTLLCMETPVRRHDY